MGLGYALTEDFPADADGRPTVDDPARPRHHPGQGHAADRRDPGRGAPARTPPTASRASARSAWCRPPARSPPRSTTSTATGAAQLPMRRDAVTATTAGLVCAHHHLYSALARGMPAPPRTPTTFLEILELVWWRLDRALDLEMIAWSARLGALEALEAGTTAIVDHHYSPERHRGQPRRHRRGVRRGRRAGGVLLRGHRPQRPRRRQGRAGRERALPPGRRAGPRRRPRLLHALRRDPRRRVRAGRRPRRRASTSTWPRAPRTPTPASGSPGGPATDWLLAHAVHLDRQLAGHDRCTTPGRT